MSATEARKSMRAAIDWTYLTANTSDGYYRAHRRMDRIALLEKEREVVMWQTSAVGWFAVSMVWIITSYTEGGWSAIPVVLGLAAIFFSMRYRRAHYREIDRRTDKVLIRGWADR